MLLCVYVFKCTFVRTVSSEHTYSLLSLYIPLETTEKQQKPDLCTIFGQSCTIAKKYDKNRLCFCFEY